MGSFGILATSRVRTVKADVVSARSKNLLARERRMMNSVAQMDDWRLVFCERIRGERLEFKKYTAYSETWTHDHCAACWATFCESEGSEIVHEGYATTDDYELGADYEWVCVPCFNDLHQIMGWTASNSPTAC